MTKEYPPLCETVELMCQSGRYSKRQLCEELSVEKIDATYNTCYRFVDGSFLILKNSEK